jgi:hypothetical protein
MKIAASAVVVAVSAFSLLFLLELLHAGFLFLHLGAR